MVAERGVDLVEVLETGRVEGFENTHARHQLGIVHSRRNEVVAAAARRHLRGDLVVGPDVGGHQRAPGLLGEDLHHARIGVALPGHHAQLGPRFGRRSAQRHAACGGHRAAQRSQRDLPRNPVHRDVSLCLLWLSSASERAYPRPPRPRRRRAGQLGRRARQRLDRISPAGSNCGSACGSAGECAPCAAAEILGARPCAIVAGHRRPPCARPLKRTSQGRDGDADDQAGRGGQASTPSTGRTSPC